MKMHFTQLFPLVLLMATEICGLVPRSLIRNGMQLRYFKFSIYMSAKESSTGHQTPENRMPSSPEKLALMERIQQHQKNASKLSKAEQIRSLVHYSTGYGVLSTNSQTLPGYPNGSVVGFSLDTEGKPIFAFSSMSSHTTDLKVDGRSSLTVAAADFKGASDGRVTLTGNVVPVPSDETNNVKAIYKERHPDAFWVEFGDFSWMRMDTLKAIRFIGGFAVAGEASTEEYMKALPDPIMAFAKPIMKHMNDDHADSVARMIEHYITGNVKVNAATIIGVDRLGLNCLVEIDGETGKLRLPFISPASDRNEVKERIIEMTNAASNMHEN